MKDIDACEQRPPIEMRAERAGVVKHPVPQRNDSLKRVFQGVEQRLLSRDAERGETPYDEMEILSFASGKLKRYRNCLLRGLPGNKSEVIEALDYLTMWAMGNWGKGT
jgi:hypothetical protein